MSQRSRSERKGQSQRKERFLTGMLASGVLWATNVAFMNHPSEIRYAARLTREVFAEVVKARQDSAAQPQADGGIMSFVRRALNVDNLADWLGRTLERETEGQVYVACFCEQGDLLSQWRGYGAAGGGYAVGFDTAALGHVSDEPGGAVLRRVIYEQDRQREILRESLEAMIALDEAWERGQRQAADNVLRGLQKSPIGFILGGVFSGGASFETGKALTVCFKDPAYEAEHEWRLIRFGSSESGARFRTNEGRIIPYQELACAPPAESAPRRLPARHIVYGPTLEPGVTDRALSMLCRSHGYTNPAVEIRRSTVPFRG